MNCRIIEFIAKMRNSVLEGLRDRKWVSYSIFKVSDVMREIQSRE